MSEHIKLSDMTKMCTEVKKWLNDRYGTTKGEHLL